jgi:asparagine synthase (glutamine-hydrolysing)
VLLARDPFGIKPLYYARTAGGGLAFASEIPPLLALPGVSRRAAPGRVYEYLRYGLTDHGSETMFADVRQLPAAHYAVVHLEGAAAPAPVRYWEIPVGAPAAISFDEAAERVRGLFVDSVRLHLRSDVPVGACLSGGIDSSAIVGATRHLGGPDLELHTFTYLAGDATLDEGRWADAVGSALCATMHKVHPTPAELAADLDGLIAAQGEPFGSTSIYAQHRVFRLAAAAGVTVMLDGQGADEQLGGYWSLAGVRLAAMLRRGRWLAGSRFARAASANMGDYRSRMLLSALGRLAPAALRPALRRAVGEPPIPPWLNAPWFRRHGVVPAPRPQAGGPRMFREELRQSLGHTTLPQLLRYEDRNSMAFSIESRVPFLTPELVGFVLSLPDDYVVSDDGTTKAVFRAAMRGLVPDAVLDRRDKIGFATPERDWLRELRPWVESVLRSDRAAAVPVFAPPALDTAVRGALEHAGFFSGLTWRALNFIRWSEQHDVHFDTDGNG